MAQLRAQFVLFDGFDPLDVVAPFEVLTAGSHLLGGDLAVELVSADGPGAVRPGTPQLSLTAVSALDPDGLDVALYLLERDFGSHIAHAVEQLFEYERRGTTWKSERSLAARDGRTPRTALTGARTGA